MDRIKRISNELMNEYSERFGTDFVTNKQSLNEILGYETACQNAQLVCQDRVLGLEMRLL